MTLKIYQLKTYKAMVRVVLLVSFIGRPPRGNATEFINTLNNLFEKMHDISPATNAFNLCFQHTIFPLTNRPTCKNYKKQCGSN